MSEDSLHIRGGQDLPGFHNLLGYHQVSWEENEAVIGLELQPCHLNLGGVVKSAWLAKSAQHANSKPAELQSHR